MNRFEYEIDSFDELKALLGDYDKNLDAISKCSDTRIRVGSDALLIEGEEDAVTHAKKLLDKLVEYMREGNDINETNIRILDGLIAEGREYEIYDLNNAIAVTSRGKEIRCKSSGQIKYVKSILKNSIVFGVGPAGTGKTYLAVALAVRAYKSRQVDKIILTRPAVEAGEKLGFLPGDLGAKVDPYLRPLYDALQEMFGVETYSRLIEKGIIEIAPLAYMRGRTLSNSFIILDEAQNTTREQMKMFLTRMGEGSKIVVTGDVMQIDLPSDRQSGLIHAAKILEGVEDIGIVRLSAKDVVRHELVARIVKAYEEAEKHIEEKKSGSVLDKKDDKK